MTAGETASERLARLLALVAYLSDHAGVPVADVAEHFGISPAQVLADVNLLWVSGTPGYLPDDLIDFSYDAYERGLLTLTDSRGMHRPLRLSSTEAIALLAALRSLEAMPGVPGGAVVASALEKLTAAAGEAADAAAAVDVRLAPPTASAVLDDLRRAILAGKVVHLRYVTGADVVSERDVDPLDLLTDGARWFLRAWCHRADDIRHFRVDRILARQVLDRPAQAHPELAGGPPGAPAPEPELTSSELVVTLELAPRARWVTETVPVESVDELADSWLRVRVRVVAEAWVRGLVLGLGPDVRSVEPDWLARSIADQAAAALAAYGPLP